jgi:2-C-methyl-D-erythritol 2,4-cyclodiphosphate synthase
MRIGLGYDIHPLVTGRKFILGGVILPFDKGPKGHSDGDCLYHALTDAILGALGLGDIGRHFPDSDPKWKDVDSTVFLKEAKRLIEEKKLKIANIDANLHVEAPKLVPHIPAMIKNISVLLGVPEGLINLKAKRGEGLDAVGRGEAVAAQAVVLLSS